MSAPTSASRSPTEAREPRMAELARLPIFLALAGKRVLVAGGTPAAAWKAELMSAAGAEVDVLASEPGDEMIALAAEPPRSAIVLHRREWTERDFAGAAIAIGAIADDATGEAF